MVRPMAVSHFATSTSETSDLCRVYGASRGNYHATHSLQVVKRGWYCWAPGNTVLLRISQMVSTAYDTIVQ